MTGKEGRWNVHGNDRMDQLTNQRRDSRGIDTGEREGEEGGGGGLRGNGRGMDGEQIWISRREGIIHQGRGEKGEWSILLKRKLRTERA